MHQEDLKESFRENNHICRHEKVLAYDWLHVRDSGGTSAAETKPDIEYLVIQPRPTRPSQTQPIFGELENFFEAAVDNPFQTEMKAFRDITDLISLDEAAKDEKVVPPPLGIRFPYGVHLSKVVVKLSEYVYLHLRNVNRGLSKIIEYSMFRRCKEHLTIYLGPVGRSRSWCLEL